jgi:hypothetical protein
VFVLSIQFHVVLLPLLLSKNLENVLVLKIVVLAIVSWSSSVQSYGHCNIPATGCYSDVGLYVIRLCKAFWYVSAEILNTALQ